jgi:hypothetical protein
MWVSFETSQGRCNITYVRPPIPCVLAFEEQPVGCVTRETGSSQMQNQLPIYSQLYLLRLWSIQDVYGTDQQDGQGAISYRTVFLFVERSGSVFERGSRNLPPFLPL